MNRQEWLKRRKIGSSDAPIIMGVSPWTTKYQLWIQKTTGVERADNANMKYGRETEEPARQKFESMTGLVVPAKNNLQHAKYDFMTANVDGLDIEEKEMVEIKCPGEKDHAMAKAGKIPEKYFPQCQHQLEVVGLERMYYFSFRNEEGIIVPIYRDDKYISQLVQQEAEFWDMILSQKPPALSSRDKEWEELEDETLLSLAKEIQEADAQFKFWKEVYEKKKNLLIENGGQKNLKFDFGSLSKSICPGAVQYDLIPELQGVNKDLYRKDPYEKWTLKFK